MSEYRDLKVGEVIQEGDEFYNFAKDTWVLSLRVGRDATAVYRRPLKPKPEPIDGTMYAQC